MTVFRSVFGDRDPFQDMQRNMDDMSRRMENLMNRLMGRQSADSQLGPMAIEDGWDSEDPAPVPIVRVGGHQDVSFQGRQVGNVNSKGQPILRVEMTPFSGILVSMFCTIVSSYARFTQNFFDGKEYCRKRRNSRILDVQ